MIIKLEFLRGETCELNVFFSLQKEGSFRSSRTTVNSLTALDYKRGGLTVIAAAVFIIGEMAGSGILTLPSAIARESKYDFWFNNIQEKSFS